MRGFGSLIEDLNFQVCVYSSESICYLVKSKLQGM